VSERVFETGDRAFESDVLERSTQVAVVVDFWAPWCGPCRTLGPLLERLAEEHRGAFLLAKVNVDENPALASAFSVQSIPMVLGFRDRQVVAEFVGALPEAGVRDFLSRLLPSEAEQVAREASESYSAGDIERAEAGFRRSLEIDPRTDAAWLGLAHLLADRGQDQEAIAALERVLPGAIRPQADRLAASLRIRMTGAGDEQLLRAKLDANPDDLETRFALAQVLAAGERYEAALEEYLEIVKRDRSFRDDGARKAMLDIYQLLGPENELVDRSRSALSRVLFR
jgi:putative thioredoxin